MGSERASELLIRAITVCKRAIDQRATVSKGEKGRCTYAERNTREVLPAKRLDCRRCSRGIADKHRGGAGKSGNETKCFKALP